LIGGADVNFKDPERRDALLDEKEIILSGKFRECVPGIEFIPDFTWAGTFAATKDALPYVGAHADFPNSYFTLGYGGNGITFSVMNMGILSDALANRPNRFLEYFRFNR
jgi:glycine/D-amino acid oxidase-like deaminating enzyme